MFVGSRQRTSVAQVGAFRRLAIIADQDTHLRQRLQQILKLSKEKWDEARDHAMKAVVVDNRMRIWWHTDLPRGNHYPRTGAQRRCIPRCVTMANCSGVNRLRIGWHGDQSSADLPLLPLILQHSLLNLEIHEHKAAMQHES